jgi:hypothetical protein
VISIACQLLAMPATAHALVVVNWITYIALWGLTLLRLWRFRTQNAVVADAPGVASALWYFGLGFWFLVMYCFTSRSSR